MRCESSGLIVALVGVLASAARGAELPPVPDYTIDLRASTYAQVFQRNLAPGSNGVLLDTQLLAPFYGYAFLRLEGLDVPWGKDALAAEVAVWGALGVLPQPGTANADGDIITAWVQDTQGPVRVKLGRQVTHPGAARYVRFDGLDVSARLAGFTLDAYAGLVALPRWNQPRGYYLLGSTADALKNPEILLAQNRANSWLVGARVGWVGTPWLKASLAFHEQHEAMTATTTSTLAFRNVAADVLFTRVDHLTLGGRLVFDLNALAPAEARLYADLTHLEKLPISIDYSYQATALLLPASSILAAFGGGTWHELGAEVSFRPSHAFRLLARAAGQAYVDRPGFRGTLRATWMPDEAQRLTVIGEYVRVGAGTNGYHNLRAAARYRLAELLTGSVDGAVYVYDAQIRGARASAMGLASVEYAVIPRLRFMLSGSVASSPFATLDAQLLGRAVFELETPSAGGGL
jgi:hypothetical protein